MKFLRTCRAGLQFAELLFSGRRKKAREDRGRLAPFASGEEATMKFFTRAKPVFTATRPPQCEHFDPIGFDDFHLHPAFRGDGRWRAAIVTDVVVQ
jgi:hypothetical protein